MRISDWSSYVCSSDLAAIWPIALPSSVAVVLVMSTLYQALLEVLGDLEDKQRESLDHAQRDALTGLSNRRLLQDRLEQAILRYRDRKSVVSGKSVSVRVDLGGHRMLKNKKHQN